jgi:hypothetical protein
VPSGRAAGLAVITGFLVRYNLTERFGRY